MGRMKAPRKHGILATRCSSSRANSMCWSGSMAAAEALGGHPGARMAMREIFCVRGAGILAAFSWGEGAYLPFPPPQGEFPQDGVFRVEVVPPQPPPLRDVGVPIKDRKALPHRH